MFGKVADSCFEKVSNWLNVARAVAEFCKVSEHELALISRSNYQTVGCICVIVEYHGSDASLHVAQRDRVLASGGVEEARCFCEDGANVEQLEFHRESLRDLFSVTYRSLVPSLRLR